MNCSLRAFLENGVLGDLTKGIERSHVLTRLGEPSWWAGKPTRSPAESDIWEYHSFQLQFDSDHRLEMIRVLFRASHESWFSDQSITMEPLSFVDQCPKTVASYDSFVAFLGAQPLFFEPSVDNIGKTVVLTNGCVAKFSRILHHSESTMAGRPVMSTSEYLVSITTISDREHGILPARKAASTENIDGHANLPS